MTQLIILPVARMSRIFEEASFLAWQHPDGRTQLFQTSLRYRQRATPEF